MKGEKAVKIVALILNAAMLIFWTIITIANPEDMTESIWAVLTCSLFFLGPILNLLIIGREKISRQFWPFLYFQRKALEEKKKIEALINTKP